MGQYTGLLVTVVLVLLAGLRVAEWYVDAMSVPACLERANHALTVTVNDMKAVRDRSALLDVTVDAVTSDGCQVLTQQRLRLSWYRRELEPLVGEQLEVLAKLRKPWGTKNPGGFDYGLWLAGQGYRGSGYIKTARRLNPGDPTASDYLLIGPGRYVHTGLLNALALGRRGGVTSEEWELFRATGTIHLMVVSGLHVGIFVGLVYAVALALLRVLPLRRIWWVPHFLALGLGLGALYLLLQQAGPTAPVVRAALMTFAFALSLMLLRRLSWWHCFGLMLIAALILQPRILVQQGFWLSYAAVASLLLFFAPRLPTLTWVRSLLSCQILLFIGLVPWLGISTGEIPMISPLANLVVLPLMTLVTIPAGIGGALLSASPLFSGVGHWCLLAADVSLSVVLHLLTQLRGVVPSFGYFPWPVALCACLAFVVMVLPVPLKIRLLAMFGWLPVLLPVSSSLPHGEFRVIVLDVGQGSSAIVDTQSHRLVVDAGAAYPSGFSLGEAVVIPALRSTGLDHVDGLLVSHPDNDHAGGMAALTQRYPGAPVTGLADGCTDGKSWRWDAVEFRIIVDAQGSTSNDRSCTLHISNTRASAYLSGDIGKRAERRMLKRLPQEVDLLVAPHHGSASSSTSLFVNRLRPRVVVFSAGRANRYQHPRADVVTRYRQRGARIFTTGIAGAVVWRSDEPGRINTQRE